jgi:arylsulfatase A-like enzyme
MIAKPRIWMRLAKNGVVLENYYAPVARVFAVARGSMLTGRLPSRNLLTAVPFPNRPFCRPD